MFDPLGTILAELRDDAAVAALTSAIRGGEPAPGDATTPYARFVVLVRLGTQRDRSVPVQTVRLGLRCYGTTPEDAAALYGACSDAIHGTGPRLADGGHGIYLSHDDTGGTAARDPDTGQPYESGVIELIATTAVVTA